MIRALIILLILGSYSGEINVQKSPLVPINSLLKNKHLKTESKFKLLIQASKISSYPNPEDGLNYSREALEMGNLLNNDALIVKAVLWETPNNYYQQHILKYHNIYHKEPEVTLRQVREALTMAIIINSIQEKNMALHVLSKIYEKIGDLPSLQPYKEHIVFQYLLIKNEKRAETVRKKMEFKMENPERKANGELTFQNKVLYIAVGSLLFLILCATFGYHQYKKQRDAQEYGKIAESEARVADMELKALRAQMNPHFIFNSLNAIRYYIAEKDIETADDYLVTFANLTRSILENSEKKYIPLAEEIRILKLYIEVEMLRMPERFSYSIIVSDNINQEKTLIPPMLIQPLVENSIWHGFAKNEKGLLKLKISKKKEALHIIIDDNGMGRKNSEHQVRTHNSMGLRLTENRLQILNNSNHKSGPCSLKITDKKKGTLIDLKLPLKMI
ncbi:sensor histidine kinase [Autumnicola psychrophila]|uniref:Histidine kinase n=1 Tax=Autumnicola psychrophila TaxID=3075592 RepID=A0ABU3DVN3_9FLAO|nr:histidine kinase [Zunongwangia sp. F225]MDT0687781.1 histidine kinase [Zunongwangia sp. F225]